MAAPPAVAGAGAGASSIYQQLLHQFPDVLNPSKDLPAVIQNVEHHIETEGRLVAAKYCRLDPVKLAAAKKEFAKMERQGIIRRPGWRGALYF
jgi:hypothetical protein